MENFLDGTLLFEKKSQAFFNIRPVSHISENKEVFCNYVCVISKASTVHQYKERIASILTQILQRPCCSMKFLLLVIIFAVYVKCVKIKSLFVSRKGYTFMTAKKMPNWDFTSHWIYQTNRGLFY